MKTNIVLVQVDDYTIMDKEFSSRFVPFCETSQVHAKQLTNLLVKIPIKAIYSSSTQITTNTAKEISAKNRIPIIVTDDLLCIYPGVWQNKTSQDIRKEWSHEWNLWNTSPSMLQIPSGESVYDFQNRLLTKVNYIANYHVGHTVCIIVHSIAAHALLSFFKGIEFDKVNFMKRTRQGAITVIAIENEKFIFKKRIKL